MQPDDETLAARAVALGDPDAFAMLMRRHQQRIFYLLWRFTRDRPVAEDLCQETFFQAWRKLASYENRGSFAGWLTKLSYNILLQHRRRRQVTGESLSDPKVQAAAEAARSAPEGSAATPDLERLLSILPVKEQDLLILTYAGGLSTAEIGAMLKVSAGTVKSRVHRAKEKIRKRFQIEAGP